MKEGYTELSREPQRFTEDAQELSFEEQKDYAGAKPCSSRVPAV
jgi:hypothetical protein